MKNKKILLSIAALIFGFTLFWGQPISSKADMDMDNDLDFSDAEVTDPLKYFNDINELTSSLSDSDDSLYYKEVTEYGTTTKITSIQKENINNFDDLSNKEFIADDDELGYDEARNYVYSDDNLTNKTIALDDLDSNDKLVHIDENYMLHVTRSDGTTSNYYHVAPIGNNDLVSVSGWIDGGLLIPPMTRGQADEDYQFMSNIVSKLPTEYQTKYQQELDNANEVREKNNTIANAIKEYRVFMNVGDFLFKGDGISDETNYRNDLQYISNIIKLPAFKEIFAENLLSMNEYGKFVISDEMKNETVDVLNKQIIQDGAEVPASLEMTVLSLAVAQHFDYENDYIDRAYIRLDIDTLKEDEVNFLFNQNAEVDDAEDGIDLYNGLTGDIDNELEEALDDNNVAIDALTAYGNYTSLIVDSESLSADSGLNASGYLNLESGYQNYDNSY